MAYMNALRASFTIDIDTAYLGLLFYKFNDGNTALIYWVWYRVRHMKVVYDNLH